MASLSNGSAMQLLMLATSLMYIIHTVKAGPVPTEICPPDREYKCLGTCFDHCDNLNSTTEVCNRMCRNGCHCKNNYIRASENSKVCVPPSECKVSCPKNMHFNPCLRGPEMTCSGETTKEKFPCRPRCVCNKGYVSNGDISDRKCIKLRDCLTPKY
ncbi:zonadhesin-like [Mixophyes fleayi]|uniref:zonadhesin-like n=1 Tax=Mixophyes fleayi TaxID=3061075 RepID=UPI003F4DEB6D